MDIVSHLGVLPEPHPTLRSAFYRIRGYVIFHYFIHILLIYHVVSAACSITSYLFPNANEVKRACAACFWDLAIYVMELNNVNIKISGDQLSPESALIISNHQSLADHILMAYLARHANRNQEGSNNLITLPRVNFFSWFLIWRVPTLRILFNLLKSDENWELDNNLSEPFFEKVLTSKVPEWIVLFPETNIWTQSDSILHKKQCEKYYLPILHNVLYPRFSGFFNVVTALKSKQNCKISTVYDVTLVYEKRTRRKYAPDDTMETASSSTLHAPSLLQFFSSETQIDVNIHVKSKLLSRIPNRRKKIERWLEHCWVEKDKFIANQQSVMQEASFPLSSDAFIDKPILHIISPILAPKAEVSSGSTALTK